MKERLKSVLATVVNVKNVVLDNKVKFLVALLVNVGLTTATYSVGHAKGFKAGELRILKDVSVLLKTGLTPEQQELEGIRIPD